MKKAIFILMLYCLALRVSAQIEGVTNQVNNNNVLIDELYIDVTHDSGKIVVTSSVPASGSSGNAIGLRDIDITRYDKNNNILWHYIWGIANKEFFPKDVTIDGSNDILIVGYVDSADTIKPFILKLQDNPISPSPVYKTYMVTSPGNSYTCAAFFHIIELQSPDSKLSGNTQYAVLGKVGYTLLSIQVVMLLDKTTLNENNTTIIDFGSSIISHEILTAALRPMTEGGNSLYVGINYLNNNSGLYGFNLVKFDFNAGTLVLDDHVFFERTKISYKHWIHLQAMSYDVSSGKLLIAGNAYDPLVVNDNAQPFYMAIDASFVNKVPTYMLTLRVAGNYIQPQRSSSLTIIEQNAYLGNNFGDLICFNISNGALQYIKSFAASIRDTGKTKGDMIYSGIENMFYGVTAKPGNTNEMSLFNMSADGQEGCCFDIRTLPEVECRDSVTGQHYAETDAQAETQSESITNMSLGVHLETVCAYCHDSAHILPDSANETLMGCSPITFKLKGCRHASNGRWVLTLLPGLYPDSTIFNAAVVSRNKDSIVIRFRENYITGLYELTYVEDVSGCDSIIAKKFIRFREFRCNNDLITGEDEIICQDSNYYIFSGCSFPSGTLYNWDLIHFSGVMNATIDSGDTSNPVNVIFSPATDTGYYGLVRTANYKGCSWRSDTLRITQVIPTFSGVISSKDRVSCNSQGIHYLISNPDSINNLTYQWSIAPSGPSLTDDQTDEVKIDFSGSSPQNYILSCVVNINGCEVEKTFSIEMSCGDYCIDPDGLYEKNYYIDNEIPFAFSQKELLSGEIVSLSYLTNDNRLLLTKTDPEGKLIWHKAFADIINPDPLHTGSYFNKYNYDMISHDFHLYVAGPVTNKKSLLVKLDENGNIVWQKDIYKDTTKKFQIMKLELAYDAGNKVDGIICIGKLGGNTLCIMKLDMNGNKIWEKFWLPNISKFSALNGYYHELYINDVLYDLEEEQYVLTGDLDFFNSANIIDKELLVMRFDRDGENTYGMLLHPSDLLTNYEHNDEGIAIIKSHDIINPGYLITGYTPINDYPGQPSSALVVKVDNDLKQKWMWKYYTTDGTSLSMGEDIEHVVDGNGFDGYAILTHTAKKPYSAVTMYSGLFFINENGTINSSKPAVQNFLVTHPESDFTRSKLLLSTSGNYYILNSGNQDLNSQITIAKTDSDGNSKCNNTFPMTIVPLFPLIPHLDSFPFNEIENSISVEGVDYEEEVYASGTTRCCFEEEYLPDNDPGYPCEDVNFNVSAFICNKEVKFTHNYSGTADSLLWTLGDGDSSQADTVVHEYTTDAKYNVCLTVFKGDCRKKVCIHADTEIPELNYNEVTCEYITTRTFTPEYKGGIMTINGDTMYDADTTLYEGTYTFHSYDSNGCLKLIQHVSITYMNPDTKYHSVTVNCGTSINLSDYITCPEGASNTPVWTGSTTVSDPYVATSSTTLSRWAVNPATCFECTDELAIIVSPMDVINTAICIPDGEDCIWFYLNTLPSLCYGCLDIMPGYDYVVIDPAFNVSTQSYAMFEVCRLYAPGTYAITFINIFGCQVTINLQVYATPDCPPELMLVERNYDKSFSTPENNNTLFIKERLELLPNPSSDVFSFNYNYTVENKTIHELFTSEVYDMSGKLVYENKSMKTNISTAIDLSSFASGIYTLKTVLNGKIHYLKMIKL